MAETCGDAARRGQKMGFDAVELHCSHGCLIARFLSGHANKRTDEFGGSLHDRMRFLRLILRDIRGKCGNDFPIIIRISGSEMIMGGLTVHEADVQKNLFFESERVDTASTLVYNTAIDIVSTVACEDAERRRNV